ncbi:MAG: hypothetical protein K2X87_33470, partial [Gemmataceae bacterium]|nr:hypothetical protein [Gemmataceae bacterium]
AEAGVKALRAAGPDHAAQLAEYAPKKAAFDAYRAKLDERQAAWEAGIRAQKPTAWTPLAVAKAESKQGPAGGPGATLTVNKDGSITASGKLDPIDVYTVTGSAKLDRPVTAVRLEVLSDPKLPAKGPGRADNGNFVLNEFKLAVRPAAKDGETPKPVKLTGAKATLEQGGYPAANAVDGNPGTGWAIAEGVGKNQAALFRFEQPVPAADGLAFTAVLDHRFGQNHVVGKFRLSVTSDPNPNLTSNVPAEVAALVDVPAARRTVDQEGRLRALYLAQDKEYQRLAAEAVDAPPADARVLGAQDLAWALINSPAFLFNH